MHCILNVTATIILMLLTLTFSSGAMPSEQWNITFGGKANDFGNDVQKTSDGGIVFTGRSSFWTHTRDGERVDNPGSDYNAYVIKTSAYGNIEWVKTFGGNGDDWANSVQQTSDGGYIFAGSTGSYGDTTGSYTDAESNVDAWIVKIDENGSMQWNRTFGGKKYDKANIIRETKDGGYIFAGAYGYGPGDSDAWLVKIAPDGKWQWSSTFGEDDEIRSIEQTSKGDFLITGISLQSTDFTIDKNAFLIKTDTNGNLLWRKTFNGKKDDFLNSISQTPDGFMLAGSTRSSGKGSTDAWLIKIDAAGNILWQKTFGEIYDDTVYFMDKTQEGEFIIAGSTDRRGTGKTDAWLFKTDINGTKKWELTLGGDESDMIMAARQTSDGDYILAGTTYSYGNGSADVWLIKVSDTSRSFKPEASSITPTPNGTPALTINSVPSEKKVVDTPSYTPAVLRTDTSEAPGFEVTFVIIAILIYLIRRNN